MEPEILLRVRHFGQAGYKQRQLLPLSKAVQHKPEGVFQRLSHLRNRGFPRRQILPAVEKFSAKLAQDIALKKAVAPVVSGIYEITLVTRLSDLVEEIDAAVEDLAAALAAFHKIDDVTESANMVRDVLLPKMEALRKPCDEAEQRTAVGCWPFPTYGDLLFGVQ